MATELQHYTGLLDPYCRTAEVLFVTLWYLIDHIPILDT